MIQDTAPTLKQESQGWTSGNQNDFRQTVQQARIQNRMSIPRLAAEIKCDTITLAAFERGDEILSHEIRQRLVKTLQIS